MVKVRRIVVDMATPEPAVLAAFYRRLFDLDVRMDMGWIVTLGGAGDAPLQMSFASEGGSGAPVPHVSIEVDDVDAVHARAVADGVTVTYPLTDEPWGVRRFFLTDPVGRVVNVLTH